VLTATPVTPVCTATGPGVYTITGIDTFTIFPMALTTSTITITGAGTLTIAPSATAPHKTLSGTLGPG